MKNSTKPTACCPSCQRFEVLDALWFSGLPELCASCADAHVNERELQNGTGEYGPTSVERAIAALDEAQREHAAATRPNPDDYPADYVGPV